MESFNEILAQIFKIKIEDIRNEMSAKDIPAWDSMNYLLFIAELEKRFDFSFTMDEVMNAKTVGDLRKAVKARGK
ncbi:MAG: acyl carrier protein [Candidatus Paceibacterota bacterium]